MYTRAILILMLVGCGFCELNTIEGGSPSEEKLIRGLSSRCGVKEPSSCIAIELVGYVDRMLRTAAVQLTDDVMIVDESNGLSAIKSVSSESLARSGTTMEDQAQALILQKLYNFATSRSIRWRLLKDADLVISGKPESDGSVGVGISVKQAKAIEEGRGRNKQLGPLLAAAAMKIGLLGGLAFKGLTLLVGKALLVSKIALLLASIIGLKKLFSHQKKHVTYEVVPSPAQVNEEWTRDIEEPDADELAYSKQIPHYH